MKALQTISWLMIAFGLLCGFQGCVMDVGAKMTKDETEFRRARIIGYSGAALAAAGLVGNLLVRKHSSATKPSRSDNNDSE